MERLEAHGVLIDQVMAVTILKCVCELIEEYEEQMRREEEQMRRGDEMDDMLKLARRDYGTRE